MAVRQSQMPATDSPSYVSIYYISSSDTPSDDPTPSSDVPADIPFDAPEPHLTAPDSPPIEIPGPPSPDVLANFTFEPHRSSSPTPVDHPTPSGASRRSGPHPYARRRNNQAWREVGAPPAPPPPPPPGCGSCGTHRHVIPLDPGSSTQAPQIL